MLQRIQSVYLIGGALAICAMFFLPILRIIDGSEVGVLYLHQMTGAMQNIYNPMLLMVTGVTTALCFIISLFMFKKRVTQMRFNAVVFLLNCALIGCMFWVPENFDGYADYKQPGILMPLLSMILLVFANKAIRKDEMKVRGSDRLR